MRSYLNEKVTAPVYQTDINGREGSVALNTQQPSTAKVANDFADRWRPLGRYSSLADEKPSRLFVCWHTLPSEPFYILF
jgi:hypothetical protein